MSRRPRRRLPGPLTATALALALLLHLPLPLRAQAPAAGSGPPVLSRVWSFPADHGAHPDQATEWWYLTGHLTTAAGRRLALQAVFFRQVLPPPAGRIPEGWVPETLYPAHMALTDLRRGTFIWREQLGRSFADGGSAAAGRLEVRSGSWRLTAEEPNGTGATTWRLEIPGEDPGVSLELRPQEPPLLHGERGWSVKHPAAGDPPVASWYYSIPRLAARGTVRHAGRAEAVTGTLWFDHEFFDAGRLEELAGWDWFGLHLNDGSALMLARVRAEEEPAVWGTLRTADGRVRRLGPGQVHLTPLRTWSAPDGEAEYPVAWEVELVEDGRRLRIEAEVPASELVTRATIRLRYWEGSVRVFESGDGRPAGEGFLEMTGYAAPLRPAGMSPPEYGRPGPGRGGRSG
jgi:predicted secreted hydrolase